MSKELEALSKELEAFEVLEKLYIEAPFNCEIDGEHVTNIVKKAIIELEELKSWLDELNETIQDLISKAKHWEEKENKTDFEKGIVRGYKTMLNQLLVGIDFDKENKK